MSNQNFNAEPAAEVTNETFRDLRRTIDDLYEVKGNSKDKTHSHHIAYSEGRVEVNWDSPNGGYVGSGQIHDEKTREYIVWTRVEGGESDTFDIYGEAIQPLGFVQELSNDTLTDKVQSRTLVPTVDGRVFEVDEGEYFSDDTPITRQLDDFEAGEWISRMSETTDSLRAQAGNASQRSPYEDYNY